MEVTINISPEMEAWLQVEAARKGIDAQDYIIDALQERLHKAHQTPYLARSEADLLQAINRGPSQQTWQRYRDLIQQRDAEALSPDEQAELIPISDQIEEANARRIECLV